MCVEKKGMNLQLFCYAVPLWKQNFLALSQGTKFISASLHGDGGLAQLVRAHP